MQDQTAHVEPFGVEVPPDAQVGDEGVLAKVEPCESGWTVVTENSLGCLVPYLPVTRFGRVLREPVEPKVGDTLTLYGGGLGSPIQGIAVNGRVVFCRTAEQQEASRRRWLENSRAEQERAFVVERAERERQYEALPEPFRQRIDRLRAEDPDFQVGHEPYEVFCLSEAAKIAEHCRTVADQDPLAYYLEQTAPLRDDDGADRFSAFGNLWDTWTEVVPLSDGHTNNTFSAAVGLARTLLDPEVSA